MNLDNTRGNRDTCAYNKEELHLDSNANCMNSTMDMPLSISVVREGRDKLLRSNACGSADVLEITSYEIVIDMLLFIKYKCPANSLVSHTNSSQHIVSELQQAQLHA